MIIRQRERERENNIESSLVDGRTVQTSLCMSGFVTLSFLVQVVSFDR